MNKTFLDNSGAQDWAIDKLDNKFDVIEYINLGMIDHDIDALRKQLLLTKLDSYTTKHRYIIFDDDTHYYLDDCSYSLTWHNIIKTFLDVDIPLWLLLVFYNGSGLLDQLLPLIPKEQQGPDCLPYVVENTSEYWITAIGVQEQEFIQNFDKNKTINTMITKCAVSMMGVPRVHRNVLQNYFIENKLLNKIAVAYNNKQ